MGGWILHFDFWILNFGFRAEWSTRAEVCDEEAVDVDHFCLGLCRRVVSTGVGISPLTIYLHGAENGGYLFDDACETLGFCLDEF